MKKLFTEKQVSVSAILGGPIPPGILIYRNYKNFDKEKEAYITLAATLIFTIAFFYTLLQLPEAILDKVPDAVFTAFYGVMVFVFFRKFLAANVNDALEQGAEKGSNWSVAGWTFVGLVLNLIIIFGLAYNQPFYDGEMTNVRGNELYYDQAVAMDDIDQLIVQFEAIDFFGTDYGNIARLQLDNNGYVITMVVDEQFWNDSQILDSLEDMRGLLEVEFNRPTSLVLESISLSGTSTYKEL